MMPLSAAAGGKALSSLKRKSGDRPDAHLGRSDFVGKPESCLKTPLEAMAVVRLCSINTEIEN
jgi:hypothetical protein